MLRNYFRLFLYLVVFIGVSSAKADSYAGFFQAIKRDDVMIVQQLLRLGLDPNTPTPEGDPALYVAVREPSPRVVQLLMRWPQIRLDQRNTTDETPLMMAALKGQTDVVRELIDRGADVNKTGWTPLHYAATGGHVPIIQMLLEAHAYIDAESPNGTTPLMMAAYYGTAAAVRALIEAGADPVVKNQLGLSAEDFAKRAERKDVVEMIATRVRQRNTRGAW
jgi:ankyrin repeat protein